VKKIVLIVIAVITSCISLQLGAWGNTVRISGIEYQVVRQNVLKIGVGQTYELFAPTILDVDELRISRRGKILTHGHNLRILAGTGVFSAGAIVTTKSGRGVGVGESGESGDAGSIYIFTPVVEGPLTVDCRGGKGSDGGHGKPGGKGPDGQNGQNGKDAEYVSLPVGRNKVAIYYTQLPTPGHPGQDGGNGENGGNGGDGGNGGNGGLINIIAGHISGGLNTQSSGGRGGIGGKGGRGGKGGSGGQAGEPGKVTGLEQFRNARLLHFKADSSFRLPSKNERIKAVGEVLELDKDYGNAAVQRISAQTGIAAKLLDYSYGLFLAALRFENLPEFDGNLPRTRKLAWRPRASFAKKGRSGGSGGAGSAGDSGDSGESGRIVVFEGGPQRAIADLLEVEKKFAAGEIDSNERSQKRRRIWGKYRNKFNRRY
jgi:hypothetical protein